MITPTIGRIVWYRRGPGEAVIAQHGGAFGSPRPACAAIVIYVWSDTMVNLVVFDHNGTMHIRTSVELCQGDTVPSGREYCEWMPYQKGQAAKTEALEAQIKA